MLSTEYVVAAFVIAIALYGIVDAVRTPYVVRRFYRDKSFEDSGSSTLDSISGSMLMGEMYTNHVHQNMQNGYSIKQFQAWSVNRRKFTLSKAVRKRNQIAWSITVIDAVHPLVAFTLLPTTVPEAIHYITDGRNVKIPDDTEIDTRYHIVTEHPNVVVPLVTQKIRGFLLQGDVVAIECTSTQVIVKRQWVAHQVLKRLQSELDVASLVHATAAVSVND